MQEFVFMCVYLYLYLYVCTVSGFSRTNCVLYIGAFLRTYNHTYFFYSVKFWMIDCNLILYKNYKKLIVTSNRRQGSTDVMDKWDSVMANVFIDLHRIAICFPGVFVFSWQKAKWIWNRKKVKTPWSNDDSRALVWGKLLAT